MTFFLYGCVALVALNALFLAALTIVRAGRFGKGNVVGVTPLEMDVYRKGVGSGAYVSNYAWSNPSARRRACFRRWLLFFPRMAVRRLLSFRFWMWVLLQWGTFFVFVVLWPEIRQSMR